MNELELTDYDEVINIDILNKLLIDNEDYQDYANNYKINMSALCYNLIYFNSTLELQDVPMVVCDSQNLEWVYAIIEIIYHLGGFLKINFQFDKKSFIDINDIESQ